MTIGRSVIYTSDVEHRLQEKSTKTDRVRIIPLSGLAYDALRAQRVQQAQDKLVAGSAYQDDGRVFQRPLGGQISPRQASQGFRSIRDRLGMSVSLHSLRHTAATMLIGGGVDVRTVSAILGHSSPTTTLTTYSHIIAGHERAAVDVLSESLGRAINSPMKRQETRS